MIALIVQYLNLNFIILFGSFAKGIAHDESDIDLPRACEASIDLAMHLVSERKLGIPKTRREGFKLLQNAEIIDAP